MNAMNAMNAVNAINHERAARLRPWLLAMSMLGLSGCALLGKSDVLTPRYFTLAEAATAQPAAASQLALALGRVSAGAELRERMAYRSGDAELAYYDDRLWTERPEVYLRRALTRALFEQRGLQRIVSGPAPVLQAELLAFEETRGKSPHVRMQVQIALDDGRVSWLTQTLELERPVQARSGEDEANAVARAFGEALHAGVEQIAERVVAQLQSHVPN